MAIVDGIIIAELLTLIAMGVVWGFHLWASDDLKHRLVGMLRHKKAHHPGFDRLPQIRI